MALYHVVGSKVLSPAQAASFKAQKAKLEAGPHAAPAVVTAPIGPSLPLTVEILHLYTGKYPNDIFGLAKPMLVTSSLKNLDITDANAEAVNFLVQNVHKKTNFNRPPADQKGTPLLCYVPAVTAISTTITFNLVFENFPDDLFQTLGSLFQASATIPLFMAASPYLIGAGSVLKLAQDVGDAIFNGKPDFNPTLVINFSDIGEPSEAGLQILFKTSDDPTVDPTKMAFDQNRGLIDPKTNQPYNGDAPYLVIGIDGNQRDALKGFTPLAASADLLARYFNIKDGGVIPVNDVVNALKAANDISYRKRAEAVMAQIATAPAEDKPALQAQLKSFLDNIQDPDLKPAQQ